LCALPGIASGIGIDPTLPRDGTDFITLEVVMRNHVWLRLLSDCGRKLHRLFPIAAFTKITINYGDQIFQMFVCVRLSFGQSDLGVYQGINLYIHIFETFKGSVCQTRYNILCLGLGYLKLPLNFTHLLYIGSELSLLLDYKSHFSLELFVVHHEDLLLIVREFSE